VAIGKASSQSPLWRKKQPGERPPPSDFAFKAKAKDLAYKAKDLAFKAKDLAFKAKD